MLSRSASLLRSSNLTRAFANTLKDYPINGFFDAKSYAIIGASEKKETLGYIISDNFYHKFQGKTFFVNPKGFKLVGVLTTRRRAVWTATTRRLLTFLTLSRERSLLFLQSSQWTH